MEYIILLGLAAAALIGIPMMLTSGERKAFESLGDVKGKTLRDVIICVGKPAAISAGPDGTAIYQWIGGGGINGGYHYALIFRDGVCEGYSHIMAG